jgi:hypothetical protein
VKIESGGNGGEYNKEIISRALNMNTLASLTSMDLEGKAESLRVIVNVVNYVAIQFNALFDCYGEVMVNIIVLAIMIALIVALYQSGIGVPAATGLTLLLAPLSANAQDAPENCYVNCTKASNDILGRTIPEPILGREHWFKNNNDAVPNDIWDICACRDTREIVIWRTKQCGKIRATDFPIITGYTY